MFKESLPVGTELGESIFNLFFFHASLKLYGTEKASIDECFIDFTRPVREEILRRYPHLAQSSLGDADTPLPPPNPITWSVNTSLVPIHPKDEVTGNPEEHSSSNRDSPQLVEPPITWHDVALSVAADMMQSARDQVRTKLGYSTSAVGVPAPSIPWKNSHILLTSGYRKE